MNSLPGERAGAAFRAAFGAAPTLRVRAPGRVNLIGEHTDYNDGFVFPCAIGVGTQVAAGQRNDGRVRVVAADFAHAVDDFEIGDAIGKSADHPWSNYVRGVVRELHRAGLAGTGADLAVAGDVPLGAGLSSSAALEIACALAIAALAGRRDVEKLRLATLCQRAENEFVGSRCGIMDQLIAAAGEENAALFIDCRSLDFRPVPAPPSVAILIAHSGVVHAHAGGDYNERRRQCEEAARILRVPALRDADDDLLARRAPDLGRSMFRRARHVVTENERTLAFASAFAAGDLKTMGTLMRASHCSMREDFEIVPDKVDELARLFNEAISDEGGARMTGGGFGGAVVALAHRARCADIKGRVERSYRRPDGKPTVVWLERPAAGAAVLAG